MMTMAGCDEEMFGSLNIHLSSIVCSVYGILFPQPLICNVMEDTIFSFTVFFSFPNAGAPFMSLHLHCISVALVNRFYTVVVQCLLVCICVCVRHVFAFAGISYKYVGVAIQNANATQMHKKRRRFIVFAVYCYYILYW